MNYGPSPEAYPMLPGPARFVQDITADLGAGKSVVVVFPDHVVESGIADAILDDIAAEGARTTHCQESSDTFPTRNHHHIRCRPGVRACFRRVGHDHRVGRMARRVGVDPRMVPP